MGHTMTDDSLQREIIEGRMDCKWGRRRPRKKLLDWMMSEEYYTANLKKLNIEKHETIGGLDLPEGIYLKKKSSKIPKNNYAEKMVSAARRQIIGGGGGGAPINKSRQRRRSQIVGGGGAARPAHSSTRNRPKL